MRFVQGGIILACLTRRLVLRLLSSVLRRNASDDNAAFLPNESERCFSSKGTRDFVIRYCCVIFALLSIISKEQSCRVKFVNKHDNLYYAEFCIIHEHGLRDLAGASIASSSAARCLRMICLVGGIPIAKEKRNILREYVWN
jgi:hypothetical protein